MKDSHLDYERIRSLARRAVEDGALLSPGNLEWDISGSCTAPLAINLDSTQPASYTAGWTADGKYRGGPEYKKDGTPNTLLFLMNVPCRKCPECLKYRAYAWRERAMIECAQGIRTWFGTMTLNPDHHYRAQQIATERCSRRATGDFDAMSEVEQFKARHDVISTWITKYLKRVRKQSGSKIRYLITAEAHKSGLPHYHCLIHERDAEHPVGERVLREQWSYGFSKFKLADEKSAFYVCKYLSKDVRARVRASVRYGKEPTLPNMSHVGASGGPQTTLSESSASVTNRPPKNQNSNES